MGPGRAGWGSTGETLTGFLPPPLSSLLPCSGEVLDLVRGEGQLVRIAYHLCRLRAWLSEVPSGMERGWGTSVRMSMEDPEESEHSTGRRGGAVASWEASFRYSQVERGNQLPAG